VSETPLKVVAAMSGGVDSAVAAARAAEAGHDVTGIHLALSRNPKSYRSGGGAARVALFPGRLTLGPG